MENLIWKRRNGIQERLSHLLKETVAQELVFYSLLKLQLYLNRSTDAWFSHLHTVLEKNGKICVWQVFPCFCKPIFYIVDLKPLKILCSALGLLPPFSS
jgi:hypothetical protein